MSHPFDPTANVRGLTLYQPWAQLVALGVKRLETRSFRTHYRGWVLVHAGQRKVGRLRDEILSAPAWIQLHQAGEMRTYAELPAGAVLALAQLGECYQVPPLGWRDDSLAMLRHRSDSVDVLVREAQVERACGDFSPGRYAWRLQNLIALEEPVPCKGGRGLWHVSLELLEQVRAKLPSAAAVPSPS